MVLGVVLSFLAACCFNLNNLMEKRAVDRMASLSARRAVHMVRLLCSDPLWVSGFFVGLAAVLLTLVAYSLAPIAVVQSIFGAGLVLLVFASRLYLRERMTRREWLGAGIIITAVLLVSVTVGSANPPANGVSTSLVLISSAVSTVVAALVLWAILRTTVEAGVAFGVSSGLFYGVAALQVKGASVLLAHRSLLRGTWAILASPYPYGFVVTSLFGLFTFQTGLQRSRVAVIGPITNIIASVFVVAVGMTVFDESLPKNAMLSVLRILGFAFVVAGAAVFATGPAMGTQPVSSMNTDVASESPGGDGSPGDRA
jgi:drug/metabolite transporter (DMT)-like permease